MLVLVVLRSSLLLVLTGINQEMTITLYLGGCVVVVGGGDGVTLPMVLLLLLVPVPVSCLLLVALTVVVRKQTGQPLTRRLPSPGSCSSNHSTLLLSLLLLVVTVESSLVGNDATFSSFVGASLSSILVADWHTDHHRQMLRVF